MPELTVRQKHLLYAALVYSQCNADDLNEAFSDVVGGHISVNGLFIRPFDVEEFTAVISKFVPSI